MKLLGQPTGGYNGCVKDSFWLVAHWKRYERTDFKENLSFRHQSVVRCIILCHTYLYYYVDKSRLQCRPRRINYYAR